MVYRVSHLVFVARYRHLGRESVHEIVHAVRPAVYGEHVDAGDMFADVDDPFHVFGVVLVAHVSECLVLVGGHHIYVVHHLALMPGQYLYS